jgi:hypothetical protein
VKSVCPVRGGVHPGLDGPLGPLGPPGWVEPLPPQAPDASAATRKGESSDARPRMDRERERACLAPDDRLCMDGSSADPNCTV